MQKIQIAILLLFGILSAQEYYGQEFQLSADTTEKVTHQLSAVSALSNDKLVAIWTGMTTTGPVEENVFACSVHLSGTLPKAQTLLNGYYHRFLNIQMNPMRQLYLLSFVYWDVSSTYKISYQWFTLDHERVLNTFYSPTGKSQLKTIVFPDLKIATLAEKSGPLVHDMWEFFYQIFQASGAFWLKAQVIPDCEHGGARHMRLLSPNSFIINWYNVYVGEGNSSAIPYTEYFSVLDKNGTQIARYWKVEAKNAHGQSLTSENMQNFKTPAQNTTVGSKGSNPTTLTLRQNYPNPFNADTKIKYSIPSAGKVYLTIYNTSGTQILKNANEHVSPGEYEFNWNGTDDKLNPVPTGIYFIRLSFDNNSDQIYSQTIKVTVVR